MPSEITASILVGPVRPESTHGQPAGLPGLRFFAPQHVLVLMENTRATWIMQRCPNLQRPERHQAIRPAAPRHLLAAAVLGYTALVAPEAIGSSPRLAAITELDAARRSVEVGKIDDDLAQRIYAVCGEHVFAAVTRLPGSTITERELRLAAAR